MKIINKIKDIFKKQTPRKQTVTFKTSKLDFIGKTQTIDILNEQDVTDKINDNNAIINADFEQKLTELKDYSDNQDNTVKQELTQDLNDLKQYSDNQDNDVKQELNQNIQDAKQELNQNIQDSKQELQQNIGDLKQYSDNEDNKIKQDVDALYGGYHITASEYTFANLILNNNLDTIKPDPNVDIYISTTKNPITVTFLADRLNSVFKMLTKFDKQKPNAINCYIVVDSIQLSLAGPGETQGMGGYQSAQQIRLTPNNQDYNLTLDSISFIHKRPWVSLTRTNIMVKVSIFRR